MKIHHKEGLPGIRDIDIPKRCAASVQDPLRENDSRIKHPGNFPNLSFSSCDMAVKMPHLDALGLLLFQVCSKAPWQPAQEYVRLARKWLTKWALELPHLSPVRNQFLSMLEVQIPRLGALAGVHGIDPKKTDQQNLADVQANERQFQKQAQLELRMHYPDHDVNFLYKNGLLLDAIEMLSEDLLKGV